MMSQIGPPTLFAEKTKLIRDDPVTVVQYFEEQLKEIEKEKILKSPKYSEGIVWWIFISEKNSNIVGLSMLTSLSG